MKKYNVVYRVWGHSCAVAYSSVGEVIDVVVNMPFVHIYGITYYGRYAYITVSTRFRSAINRLESKLKTINIRPMCYIENFKD